MVEANNMQIHPKKKKEKNIEFLKFGALPACYHVINAT